MGLIFVKHAPLRDNNNNTARIRVEVF